MDLEVRELTLEPTLTEVQSNSNSVDIVTVDNVVEGYKKEYSIVGDALYAKVSAEDAPQWLLDIIDAVTANKLGNGLLDIQELRATVLAALDEIDIAKNAYEELINIEATIDSVIATRLETLNATLNTNSATIANLDTTFATKEYAGTLVASAIESSINDGSIKSELDSIKSTLSTETTTRADQVTSLVSVINDETTGLLANASAIETLYSNVTVNNEALAQWQIALENYLETGNTDNTNIDSQTNIYNTLKSNITSTQSKFGYDSTLVVNGVAYNSGFGLVSSGTLPIGSYTDSLTNTTYPLWNSEFWVKADKFKISSASNVGYTPFYISGNKLVLNGTVSFVNTSGGTGTLQEVVQSYVETVQVGDKNINITDNLIPTTSLLTDVDNAGYEFIGTPSKSSAIGIDTFAEPQIILDGADEVYSPYVDEMALAYYYRVGIYGITSLNRFKIVTINSSNVATVADITYTLDAGQSLVATNWYVIDGIINPVGGNTSPSGSIRTASGTKIGTINNFVIPVGAIKLVLGFIANCTISRMKLSKITADTLIGNYTTQDYVDNSIANIDVSWDALSNKDAFAQKLGYINYAAMEIAATNGTTLINGGYINTGLINANAITANQINTSGLIADNISGINLVSKNISGSSIYGAYIEGAVIKASYLDLDGELEVLTNYHIPVASYNPSTMPGAIYITGTNEYRLPTTSSIETISPTVLENTTNIFTSNQPVYPYNSYWTTSTRRAVKIRPVITVPNDIVIFSSSVTCFMSLCGAVNNLNYTIYIGGINVGVLSGTITGTGTNTIVFNGNIGDSVCNGITFNCSRSSAQVLGPAGVMNVYSAQLIIKAGNYTLANDWVANEFIKFVYNSGTDNGGNRVLLTFGDFTINNMV